MFKVTEPCITGWRYIDSFLSIFHARIGHQSTLIDMNLYFSSESCTEVTCNCRNTNRK